MKLLELSYLNRLPTLAAIGWPLPLGVMLLLHCLIGLVAAQLAHRKGADLGGWLLWGMVGGTLSLVTALRLPRLSAPTR
ncbi:MAG TPA: hypothetical protein V6D02_01075 [Candidatus Obscuribacterales bacterium]